MTEEIVREKQSQLYKRENELANLRQAATTVEQQLEGATRQADAERLIRLTAHHNELPALIKAAQIKVATANIELLTAQQAVANAKLQKAHQVEGEQAVRLRDEIKEAEQKLAALERERLDNQSQTKMAQLEFERLSDRVTDAQYALNKMIREQTNRETIVNDEAEYIYFGKPIERGSVKSFDV